MKNRFQKMKKGLMFLFLMVPILAFAQNVTVSGIVSDKSGEPLAGVTVVVVGSSTATMTDFDGNYQISVPQNGKLIFSFVGYTQQTIDVNGRKTINVTLSDDAIGLQEVVAIGYGTQRREAVTGSVASMQGDALREVQSGNLTAALAGRIAGVQMSQTSSKPGADMQILIRGTRSFSGSNAPMIVLDGIPFPGTLGDISPADIKTIDILKDASSTAIYGSRGAGGVIMITTNKGARGEQKAKVSYDTYYGVKTLFHRYPMMTGDELYKLRKDAGVYVDADGVPNMVGDEVLGTNTDWQDLMFGTGMTMNHHVSVAGGTQNGSYNFGAGYFKDQSLLPGQDYSRINLRANIDQGVGKYLRFGLITNNNYNITNGQNLGMYNALGTSPLINPYNEDGSLKSVTTGVADTYWTNTYDRISNLGDSWADNRRAFGSYNNIFGEVKIPGVEGLSYRINVGLNFRTFNRGQYKGVGIFDNSTAQTAASDGSMEKSLTYQWTVDNILTYDRNFGKHHVTLTGLYSAEHTHVDRSLISATNIPAEFFLYWNLAQATNVTFNPAEQRFQEWALQSVLGRAMYDYDNRYMLYVMVRSDGSSRLAPGHKWHTYPAVSLGWNISKEAFMSNVQWVNHLKLRAGYGQTSNQEVDPYATLGLLDINKQQYNFGSVNTIGAYVSMASNPKLGWEYSQTWNVGLDFSLIQDRLWGTAEYYIVNTTDILYKVPLPQTSGVAEQWANVGKMQNKGFELSLNGKIIKTKDWTWDLGVNFYINKNKVTYINSGVDKNPSLGLFVGHPVNAIYDAKKIGIWNEGDAYMDILEPNGLGLIKIQYTGEYDANGNPVRALDGGGADRIIQDADPAWQGGFNTRVAWKNFDLSVIGTYQHGGILVSSIYADNGYLNMLSGRRGNVKVDYWTPENTGAKYPKPGGGSDNPKYSSTLGYFDASYFRVGQISLGYTFDPNATWFKNLGLGSARLYVTVQNAFVLFSPFNKESGLDVLTNSKANENAAVTTNLHYSNATLTIGANTPQTRNFMFGLNLSF